MVVGNALLILLAGVGFSALHSLTAGSALKQRLQKVLDARLVEGWYRLAYNLVSVVSIAPLLLLVAVLPDRNLYVVPPPYSFVLLCIQLVGAIGFLWGAFSVDLWRFIGARQVVAYLGGEPLPLPDEPLQQEGIYRLVRHPLYLFGLLMLWPIPVMTLNLLVASLGATLYVIIGSLIEERRLLNAYGEKYRQYRQRVPWLIPFPSEKHRAE